MGLAGRFTSGIANGSLQRSLVWLVLAALAAGAAPFLSGSHAPLVLRAPQPMPLLGWLLWLMPLAHNDIGSLNVRLQFTSDFLASLFAASTMFSNLDSFIELKPSQFVERVGLYPLNAVEAVYFMAHDEKLKDIFFKYLSEWRHIKPTITGDDLQTRGMEPGPKYGEILRRLRAAWLDGEISSKEQESKLLNELL